jgi:hypothetical protein
MVNHFTTNTTYLRPVSLAHCLKNIFTILQIFFVSAKTVLQDCCQCFISRFIVLDLGGKGNGKGSEGKGGKESGEQNGLGVFNAGAVGAIQCSSGNLLPNVRLVSRTIHTDQVPMLQNFFPSSLMMMPNMLEGL